MKTLILLFFGACLCLGSFALFTALSSVPTNFATEQELPSFYRLFFNFKCDPKQNKILYPSPTLLTNIIIGACLVAGLGLIYKSVSQLEKTRPPQPSKPLPLQFLKPYLPSAIILLSILLMTGIVHTMLHGSWIINIVVGTTLFLGVFGLHSMYKSLTGRTERTRWLILVVATMCVLMAHLTLNALL